MERWIPGYVGRYLISDDGVVISLKNGGRHIMRPYKLRHGYMRVILCHKGIKTMRTIHRLVALAFIPNPDGKPEVNHKDFNKSNNRVWNLEWTTPKENSNHTRIHSKLGNIKLNDLQVKELRNLYLTGDYTLRELGIMFGINTAHAGSIVNNNRRRTDVTSISNTLSGIKRNNYLSRCAKVNIEQVREMRELYKQGGFTYKTLADKYGIHKSRVGALLAKKTWGWEEI